jgi:cobaltochelatase CobS
METAAQVVVNHPKMVAIAEAFVVDVPKSIKIKAGPGGKEVPAVNAAQVFDPVQLGDFLTHYRATNDPIWIRGPKGCGKTSFVMQVAARLNIPVFYTTGKEVDAVLDWIGTKDIVDGDTVFTHGPLPLAMMAAGWLVIDEADLTPPGQLAELNNVLAGGALTIDADGADVIEPAPGFRVIALGNTSGNDAQQQAAYLGTKMQNQATLDRYAYMNFDYPSRNMELKILEKAVPELGADDREFMVDVAIDTRTAVGTANFGAPLSTRILVRWGKYTLAWVGAAKSRRVNPLVLGLAHAFTNGLTEGEVDTIHTMMANRHVALEKYFSQARTKGVDPVAGPVEVDNE